MAEMALQRTPISQLVFSSPVGTVLSSRSSFPAKKLNHFDAFSGTRSVVLRGKAQKRAGAAHLRIRVCRARASVGEDRRDDREKPHTFPPPVSES